MVRSFEGDENVAHILWDHHGRTSLRKIKITVIAIDFGGYIRNVLSCAGIYNCNFPMCFRCSAGLCRKPECRCLPRVQLKQQECRDAQDAKRDIQVAVSPSLVTTAYYAPAALRPCRFATPSHARYWLRSTPANGLTACRMRLHMPFAGLGPIRPQATTAIRPRLRLPGTTRPRFALHGAQRLRKRQADRCHQTKDWRHGGRFNFPAGSRTVHMIFHCDSPLLTRPPAWLVIGKRLGC